MSTFHIHMCCAAQGGFSGWTSSKLQTKMSNTVSAVEILAPVFGTVRKAATTGNGNRVRPCFWFAFPCLGFGACLSLHALLSYSHATMHVSICLIMQGWHLLCELQTIKNALPSGRWSLIAYEASHPFAAASWLWRLFSTFRGCYTSLLHWAMLCIQYVYKLCY